MSGKEGDVSRGNQTFGKREKVAENAYIAQREKEKFLSKNTQLSKDGSVTSEEAKKPNKQ